MTKYITFFIISLALSSLLLSIEWFTWQAWIFVSVYMLIQYWYQMCRSSDAQKANINVCNKFDDTKKTIVRLNESLENLDGLILNRVEALLNKADKIRKILIHEAK